MSKEEPGTGHNSAGAGETLNSYVTRIERLAEERQERTDDIKEIYAEAKGNGFDVKVLRKVIARRKRDREEVREEDAIIALYEDQLGVFS